MTTAAAVTTERRKPTPERFSSGKLRPKKVESRTDSPPLQETKRGCYICGTIERGDSFTSLPDSDGVGRVVHVPINAESGKAASRNLDCRTTFESGVAAANKRKVQEQREDLALAALRREGGESRVAELAQSLEMSRSQGSNPTPRREIFACSTGDCPRFFDSENGRDLHLRRGHKA